MILFLFFYFLYFLLFERLHKSQKKTCKIDTITTDTILLNPSPDNTRNSKPDFEAPPPNIGFDYNFPRTTANPKALDHFFNNNQPRNSSKINNANLNLTLLGSLLLLVYSYSNNFKF